METISSTMVGTVRETTASRTRRKTAPQERGLPLFHTPVTIRKESNSPEEHLRRHCEYQVALVHRLAQQIMDSPRFPALQRRMCNPHQHAKARQRYQVVVRSVQRPDEKDWRLKKVEGGRG